MFSKTAYAIKTQKGTYLSVQKTKLSLDVSHEESPEDALIWGGRKEADDLLFYAQQHLGEKCLLVEFELVEKNS